MQIYVSFKYFFIFKHFVFQKIHVQAPRDILKVKNATSNGQKYLMRSNCIWCSETNVLFTYSDEGTGKIPAWCELHGPLNGWKCCTGSRLEFRDTCISNGTYLGQEVHHVNYLALVSWHSSVILLLLITYSILEHSLHRVLSFKWNKMSMHFNCCWNLVVQKVKIYFPEHGEEKTHTGPYATSLI